MCNIHQSFKNPPHPNWAPQVGDDVRILFENRTFEGRITQISTNPKAYVVSSDDLLLPVVCDRDSLRPMPKDDAGDA